MIFVDTSAFLAIENRRDASHTPAINFRDAALRQGKRLITSDYVLDESYTIIRLRAGHAIAVAFGEALRHSQVVRIEPITPELVEAAWHIFKTYADHAFSFTDCTSFALMEHLTLKEAFSFDQHFHEYGRFIVHPD
jgi:predicted nucleic acid-binding protein